MAFALAAAILVVAVDPLRMTPASAAVSTIPALADATVDSSAPATNFGNDAALGTDNSPVKRFLMKFDVSSLAGQTISAAKLRLFNVNKSSKGGSLRLVTSAWSEGSVTWNTPVTFSSTVISSLGSVSVNNWYELDVTGVVGGTSELDVIVTSTSSDGADYASSEAPSGNGPQLVVTTTAPPPPPPNQAPEVTISAPADGADLVLDKAVTFTGSATDEDGSLTAGLAWVSNVDGPIGSGGSFTYTFTTEGPRTITATVADSEGLPGSASITVQVAPNRAPEVTISAPADQSSVVRNQAVTFTGSATDEDGSLTAGLTWSAMPDDVTIGSGGSFSYTFTTLGERTITASVTDSDGAEGSASITVEVVAPPSVTTFDVGLVGDTGYTSSQITAFKKLRDTTLNKAGLAFVTHDGDIKNGSDPCTDSVYTTWRDIFNGFTVPLVYTPGDNEWKDCSDPNGRLSFLRQIFFSTNKSLGQTKLTVTQQAGYPENARWTHGNVVFATLNTPGSNNNSGDKPEYTARNRANLDWMRAAFAAGENARGVVIVTQANWGAPYGDSTKSAFADSVALLEDLTVDYGKPVVLVHGDSHHFRIDHPMSHNGQVVSKFTRVETYAPSSTKWVKLSIVADDRVFAATSQSAS